MGTFHTHRPDPLCASPLGLDSKTGLMLIWGAAVMSTLHSDRPDSNLWPWSHICPVCHWELSLGTWHGEDQTR